MDPYLVAAGGFVLAGLGCLGADLYNIATPGDNTAELWSAEAVDLATGLAAAGVLISRGAGYLTQAGKSLFEIEDYPEHGLSPILGALALTEALEMLMGFGTPYQGEDLHKGAHRLAELGEQLQGTAPGSSWRSAAAQAYTEQVEAEQGAAEVLATIDLGLADLAQQCANFVTHARLAIGLLKALLLAGYLIELKYYEDDYLVDGWTFAGKVGVAGALAVGAIGFAFGVYFANKLEDGAVEIGAHYDMVGQQPHPPAAVTAAVAAEPTVAGTAQHSVDRRFFFSTETQAATILPEATPTPAPAPQPSSAKPGLSVSAPTAASPSGSGQPMPRGYARPAPVSKQDNISEAPPAEEAQPDLELELAVDQPVPLAAAGVSPNQAAARMPTPAS